ncbi:DnaJ domain-containing protein [Pisolithus marmoratus]|nr:DnaJ domain-containing protein [Pisolithus marmoratus]
MQELPRPVGDHEEDYEIFDLVSDLEASEGKGTTFYSWLEVPPAAPLAQINKAYRKKSIELHPDKNPGVRGVHERFARLGVIVNILRSPESRARYDFFYKNGVPKWRGTGYYYTRFRPGLGTVLIFLTLLTTGLQYLVQMVNYSRDLNRIRQTIHDAKVAAWGPKMMQSVGKRKVKVNLGGGPRIDEDGRAVPGKVIDMVVDGDAVYIPDFSGDLHELNEETATPPALARTWLLTLLREVFRLTIKDKSEPARMEGEGDEGEDNDYGMNPAAGGTPAPSGTSEADAPRRGMRAAAVKAGGRRKAVRK